MDGGSDGDSGSEAPDQVCTAPVELADVSAPTATVGDGNPASCTETRLKAAAAAGGVITFNCGPDPVTITLTQQIDLPVDTDTVIDGGGLVTLDGGGVTRHFYFEHPDWMNNPTRVLLQRLTLRNGGDPRGCTTHRTPATPAARTATRTARAGRSSCATGCCT
jgi:hypothetical protein